LKGGEKMLEILFEIFKCLLVLLGIVVVFSMVVGVLSIPFENRRKKKELAKAKEQLKEISKKMSDALVEELKRQEELEKQSTKKTTTSKTRKTTKKEEK
jgi:FtsZ-interacting cell division protein ZipA